MAIDHEKRRADIASITIDLVAREGIEAASLRRIAAEAGFSTSAVTHYFADKQELIVWAFTMLSGQGQTYFDEAWARDPEDVAEPLMTLVPWCPVNVRRWKAYLAFWDQGARDTELAALLRQSTYEGIALLRRLIAAHVPIGADTDSAARLLNAVIQGIALQMLVDAQYWNKTTVRATLAEAFDLAVLKARPR